MRPAPGMRHVRCDVVREFLRVRCGVGLALTLAAGASPGVAEAQTACHFLCTPQVLIEPTFTIENLVEAPRMISPDGQRVRAGRDTVFEIILAVDVPTRVPRLGFTAEAIFPLKKIDNAVQAELEVNLDLIRPAQTKGWVSSHVDIVDKFSPAERPTARSAYTHKLNFEWDTAAALFSRLPARHWLRNVELEGSLDYVATGLPRAGDESDGERFATNASPWSFSIVLVIPLTP